MTECEDRCPKREQKDESKADAKEMPIRFTFDTRSLHRNEGRDAETWPDAGGYVCSSGRRRRSCLTDADYLEMNAQLSTGGQTIPNHNDKSKT